MSHSELNHYCGICAIYSVKTDNSTESIPWNKAASSSIPRMLVDLQHRGQLAAGMTTYSEQRGNRLKTYKELGPVYEAFKMNHQDEYHEVLSSYSGRAGLGHVRYATTGDEGRDSSQPFERKHSRLWKWYSFAFNGQISNYQQLKKEYLEDHDLNLINDTDSELLMHLISSELRGLDQPDFCAMFSNLAEKIEGAWNTVYLNAKGQMVVSRDPDGFRPMCWAFDGSTFAAASEDVALRNLGFGEIFTLEPGELVEVSLNEEPKVRRFAKKPSLQHCVLEWMYFSSVASTLDGSSVFSARSQAGKKMALAERERGILELDEDTIVVPVPETANTAASSMAYYLNVRLMEGIVRNRYVGRTFIQGQGNRSDRVKMKYTPIRSVLEGKRVILVDDTIVRSTTMLALVNEIRTRGKAKEVHIRVACPPLIGPCYYGLDISTISELFVPSLLCDYDASDASLKLLANALEADSIGFLELSDVSDVLDIKSDNLCMACFNGEHPCNSGRLQYDKVYREFSSSFASGKQKPTRSQD